MPAMPCAELILAVATAPPACPASRPAAGPCASRAALTCASQSACGSQPWSRGGSATSLLPQCSHTTTLRDKEPGPRHCRAQHGATHPLPRPSRATPGARQLPGIEHFVQLGKKAGFGERLLDQANAGFEDALRAEEALRVAGHEHHMCGGLEEADLVR